MNKVIYLDNAATTKPLEIVADCVRETMLEVYGNPSSLHKKGMEAENILKEANKFFAKALGCTLDEIYYTSGGTESNNLSIIGTAMAYKRYGTRIITSQIEHPSVGEVYKYLESLGFEIVTIGVNNEGYLNVDELKANINDNTILVSVMHVNNELGTIQDIEQIGKLIKDCNKQTIFHVDAVQSFAKTPLNVKKAKVDLLSISGHKFYGPRGIGILYKNKEIRLQQQLFGGGQQKNLRSGTENVAGVNGARIAATYVINNQKEILEHMLTLKIKLANGVQTALQDVWVNGPGLESGAPYILNMGFKDVRAEVLLHALEQEGIYVSSSSACSTHKKEKAGVLKAIGLRDHSLENAIRFSFSHDTKIEDIDKVIQVIIEQVTKLRKYVPGGNKIEKCIFN